MENSALDFILFHSISLVSLYYVFFPTGPEAPLGQEMLNLFVYVHTLEEGE